MVLSEDDGFTWSSPRWTNIWGYPSELINLLDGRVLMVYGYRRPPYGTRGCISEDGVTWDRKNEFVIREGGIPRLPTSTGSTRGGYQHIGYPSVCQLEDGTLVAAYHEWTDEADPIQM